MQKSSVPSTIGGSPQVPTSTRRRSPARQLLCNLRFGAVVCLTLATFAVAARGGDALPEVQARLLDDVKFLASDELEGRGVETEGINQAADYIKRQFAAAGLDVQKVDGDAFQPFTIITGSKLGTPNSLELAGPDGKPLVLELDKEFRPTSFSDAGKFDGPIVFCGYGIDHEEYSDFDGIDIKGKTVIIMRRVPQQANPHGLFAAAHGGIAREADLRTKVSNAFSRGAKAILFVTDPYTSRQAVADAEQAVQKAADAVVTAAEELVAAEDDNAASALREKLQEAVKRLQTRRTTLEKLNPDELMEFGHGGRGRDRSLPAVHMTQDVCDRILKPALGKTLAELEAEIDSDLKPRSVELENWSISGVTTVERVKRQVKNVIGVIEGTGPLAEETIVIGAHYDHIGRGQVGSLAKTEQRREIHNGADDNASGTAALIELARRFAASDRPPSRRLVFIAFTAEELGLLGSAHYVKEPVFPLEKTIAMFNMDMVGRLQNNKLTVFGTGTAPRWKELVESQAGKHQLELALKPDGIGPSDHTSFYQKQIPVLHFFTGTHSDYHRPGDDWEKINLDGMNRVTDFIEMLVAATLQTRERPQYVAVQSKAQQPRGGNRPYFGSIPNFGTEGPGYDIQGVSPGSPADKGGLQGGDSIVQFGEFKIGDLNDFDLALRKFSAGDEVEIVVVRKGQEVKLKVTLGEPK